MEPTYGCPSSGKNVISGTPSFIKESGGGFKVTPFHSERNGMHTIIV
jgi:hypothetical protein